MPKWQKRKANQGNSQFCTMFGMWCRMLVGLRGMKVMERKVLRVDIRGRWLLYGRAAIWREEWRKERENRKPVARRKSNITTHPPLKDYSLQSPLTVQPSMPHNRTSTLQFTRKLYAQTTFQNLLYCRYVSKTSTYALQALSLSLKLRLLRRPFYMKPHSLQNFVGHKTPDNRNQMSAIVQCPCSVKQMPSHSTQQCPCRCQE